MTPARTGGRLAVDIVACDGRGICAEVIPQRIVLDDWGYPIIDPTPVPVALAKVARQAVQLCPKLALRLEAPTADTSRVDPLRP